MGILEGHDVRADTHTMIHDVLPQEADALCTHEGRCHEHEVLGKKDLLVAKIVLTNKAHFEKLVPRVVLKCSKYPVGVILPAEHVLGKLVLEDEPWRRAQKRTGSKGLNDGEHDDVGLALLGTRDGTLHKIICHPIV